MKAKTRESMLVIETGDTTVIDLIPIRRDTKAQIGCKAAKTMRISLHIVAYERKRGQHLFVIGGS